MPMEWEDVKNWLKDVTKLALKEAEDLTTKGKIKIEIFSLSQERERLFSQLGNLFYNEYQKHSEIKLSEKIIETINKIEKIEEKIKLKKEELKQAK
ncbi:MAG: hypothetical protein N2748_02040 [candidate division WOR-3 bacterium]|nr:hypothetical protein [candidate division WOR-3 bacterium]